MHVKFEESNFLVKNVINCQLGKDIEKMSMKDSLEQEEKSREDQSGKVQEVQDEDQPTQPLSKECKYASSHLKDLIIGDISKEVTIRFKHQDICGHYAFISHIESKNILEAEGDSYWLLAMQEKLNQFEHNRV